MFTRSSRFPKGKDPEVPGPGTYDVKPLGAGGSIHIPMSQRWNEKAGDDVPLRLVLFPLAHL